MPKLEANSPIPEVVKPILAQVELLRNKLQTFVHHICGDDALKFNEFEVFFKKEDTTCYLDDGNTQTPAVKWTFLYVIPIMREYYTYFHEEWTGYYHGHPTSALIIDAYFTIRRIDDRIKSSGSEIVVSPLMQNTTRRTSHERVQCSTNGMPYLQHDMLMIAATELQKLMKEHETKAKVNSFIKQHLDWIE